MIGDDQQGNEDIGDPGKEKPAGRSLNPIDAKQQREKGGKEKVLQDPEGSSGGDIEGEEALSDRELLPSVEGEQKKQ